MQKFIYSGVDFRKSMKNTKKIKTISSMDIHILNDMKDLNFFQLNVYLISMEKRGF